MPEEDLFPYHTYHTNQETGGKRVTGSYETCARCLSLKKPDAEHPPFERTAIPQGFRDAFPDGELSWPDEAPEADPPQPYYPPDEYQE